MNGVAEESCPVVHEPNVVSQQHSTETEGLLGGALVLDSRNPTPETGKQRCASGRLDARRQPVQRADPHRTCQQAHTQETQRRLPLSEQCLDIHAYTEGRILLEAVYRTDRLARCVQVVKRRLSASRPATNQKRCIERDSGVAALEVSRGAGRKSV